MKKIIILIFVFVSVMTYGQMNSKIDSLTNLINTLGNDTNKVIVLSEIAKEYRLKKPNLALEYLKKALFLSEELNDQVYISNCCLSLGILYKSGLAKYDSSEYFINRSMAIRESYFGKLSVPYASCLNNLASLYTMLGKYKNALESYKSAIIILENILGKEDPSYATTINNLAELYRISGNYAEAEPLYKEAQTIYEKKYGRKSASFTAALNNLGELYKIMGNNIQAELMFKDAEIIRKEILGEKHPDYARILNNLAALYNTTGDFENAELLYLKASSIWKESLGEKHPDYLRSLSNLGNLYVQMGKLSQAEVLLMQAKNTYKEIYTENNVTYTSVLSNIAELFLMQGKVSEAEVNYLQAKNIRLAILGSNHFLYLQSLMNLANLYNQTNRLNEAANIYKEAVEKINFLIFQNFSFLSEAEKELLIKSKRDDFHDFLRFSMAYKNTHPEISIPIANLILRNKGLLLKSSTALRFAILNSDDSVLINKYFKWVDLKRELIRLYSTEISKRVKSIEDVENQTNIMEKDLVKSSNYFNDIEKLQSISWEHVRNNLRDDEAAVEFFSFKKNRKSDSLNYAAILIRKNSKYPEIIYLCSEWQISKVLSKHNYDDNNNVHKVYGARNNINDSLYGIIWKPMEKYLFNTKTIYYSPDGILHKISFAAIGNNKQGYLCNNFNLKQMGSINNIGNDQEFNLNKNYSVGIFGGIDYSTDTTTQEVWDYLPGAKKETEKINSLFNSKNINTFYQSGKNAAEIDFKEHASGLNIIHIATHGFFFPDPQKNNLLNNSDKSIYASISRSSGYGLWQFTQNKNPLMRSGLAFTYANNVWNQKYLNAESDGVLTAIEVSQLDLHKTELLVLSACETALGDIMDGEGVYGMQRAFKMAGVKYIIMSLWQVPDKETVEFMTTFYTKLLKNKGIRQAFNETQIIMRKKYDPYYWAAFVLME